MTEPQFYTYPDDVPFSEAVEIGGLIYLSGHIGDDDDGRLAHDFEAEVEQMVRNVRASLGRFDLDISHLISVKVMLTDMAYLDQFNDLFHSYWAGASLPACSVFGVSALAIGASVEIECVARRA